MLSLTLCALTSLSATGLAPDENLGDWTILFYGATENSAEESFMPDIEDMRQALDTGPSVEVLCLVDRSERFTDSRAGFGEDFSGARLYRFDGKQAQRLDGGSEMPEIGLDGSTDLNMGDAATLARFMRWGKAHYPARHYALVFYSHGGGWSWCPDEGSANDQLQVAEITQTLGEKDSVDLMVMDVCSMGGIENAYQWRPGNGGFSADYLLATPNAGYPFPWGQILGRMRAGAAVTEGLLDVAKLEAADFGRLIIDETRGFRERMRAVHPGDAEHIDGEAQALLDLSMASDAKQAFDQLAVALAASTPGTREEFESYRGFDKERPAMDYFTEDLSGWSKLPSFDAYGLARDVYESAAFSAPITAACKSVMQTVDQLVVHSFGMAKFEGFEPGRHGVYVIFPGGWIDRPTWSQFRWLHPDEGPEGSGNYAWCRDGATPGNGEIENWFELLDAWYDE
ncbi:MAG: clostripain, partial [Gammaproteobacteria bacterium]